MSANPKLFIHNIPIEICTSVQRGLPFVHAKYIEVLILGILAAAQTKYPITICHYVVMANHIHILVIVQNPEDVPLFMDYFKTEVAHAMNRLMGTSSQSFWESGYDSPIIISANKFLERMEYLYLNPVMAGASRRCQEYKGLNTFGALFHSAQVSQHKKISRDQFEELPHGILSKRFENELANQLIEGPGKVFNLRIEPWAWLECFKESKDWDVDLVRERFLSKLRESEKKIEKENPGLFKSFQRREIRTPYKSQRCGVRMICLSDCPRQRAIFISIFKELKSRAKEVFHLMKRGIRALPPPGFFLPGRILTANIVLPFMFLF